MRIREVRWPKGIREKVGRKHGLLPEQVESAIFDRRAHKRVAGGDRYFVFGQAADGVYIIAVVAHAGGIARVISARMMTVRERRTYQKRGK